MYLQLDSNNRILGASQEQNEFFPVEYSGDLPENFDDYLLIDGDLVYDQRDINAAMEAQNRVVEKMECMPILAEALVNEVDLPDETALKVIPLFPDWKTGTDYWVDFKVQHGGLLYRCLIAHTSQETWTPDVSPSLWARVLIPDPGVIPEWEQPGSTNPYMKGDKVRHNGSIWVSDIDYNVYEPGVYGWTKQEG